MAMTTNPELFAGLCQAVGGHPDRRGHVHITCPECGKEVKRGQTHCSFSARGVHCFVCGYSASLQKLAEALGARPLQPARIHQPRQEPPKPRQWQQAPERYLQAFLEALDRVEAWQRYKPLTLESISRWQLGVGVLPSSQCSHRRLIYPLLEAGRIVGFRGRAIRCDCPKWLTAGGSLTMLWGLELVTSGCDILVVENPVDAMLAMQVEPTAVAVGSTAGAATWRDEWTAGLVERRPRRVLVWLDHDLAGNGSRYHHAELVAAWRVRNPTAKRLPCANGPKICNRLLAAGLRASLYQWPAGTPPKADLGSLLTQSMGGAA